MKTALIILILLNSIRVYSEESNSNLNIKLSSAFVPNNDEVQAKILTPFITYEKHLADNLSIKFGFGSSFLILNREGFGEYSSIDISNIMLGAGYAFIIDGISKNNEVSFSIGIPTAFYKSSNIDDKKLTEFNYTSIISAEGWSEPYPWLINNLPFILSYEGKFELSNYLYIDYLIKPSFLLSLNDRPSGIGLQNCLNIGINIDNFNTSIGYNIYYTSLNLENNDNSQSSIIMKSSLKFNSLIYFLSLGLNLDKPNGILYDVPKTNWGLSFGLQLNI